MIEKSRNYLYNTKWSILARNKIGKMSEATPIFQNSFRILFLGPAKTILYPAGRRNCQSRCGKIEGFAEQNKKRPQRPAREIRRRGVEGTKLL